MEDLEKVMKAFANKRRLAIVKYLKANKEASVRDVASEIHLSLKSTSKHLNILAVANILEKDQRSLEVFYRIPKNSRFVAKHIIQLI